MAEAIGVSPQSISKWERGMAMKSLNPIKFSFGLLWDTKKAAFLCCFIAVFAQVAWYFLLIFIPRAVIDEITDNANPMRFVVVVGSLGLAFAVVSFLKNYTDGIVERGAGLLSVFRMRLLWGVKQSTMDYALFEKPEALRIIEKAERANGGNNAPCHSIPKITVSLAINVINFALYGGIILMVHPVILLFLGVSIAINTVLLHLARKYEKSTRDNRSVVTRRLSTLLGYMRKEEYAKDIRLYGMAELLRVFTDGLITERAEAEGAVAAKDMRTNIVSTLMIFLRDGAAYAFLVYLMWNGQINLGEFVFIFAAIGMFSTWVLGINSRVSELMQATSEMGDIEAFLNLADESNTKQGHYVKERNIAPTLTLEDVTYTYPGAESPTLKNISIKIKPGERIAVVGNNGAGKTTLVKLLCGLYYPSGGEVKLNDTSSKDYNRDEYFGLFSAVFQDIHFLAESIAVNVSQKPENLTDYAKVDKCLTLAGFYEKSQSLPDKEKTMLVRRVNANAVELSGGEKQKLAIARALYKDAPVIILDEPTAALDPVSEFDVYSRISDSAVGKAVLYISHRLASCRFCGNIIVLHEGSVVQSGKHDSLIADTKGKYHELWNAQAQYYGV